MEFGDSLQAAVIDYRSKYPRPFEQRYAYYTIIDGDRENRVSRQQFNQFAESVKTLLKGQDCIGCLNFYEGQTYGFLCMDISSYEKLEEMIKSLDRQLSSIKIRKTYPEKV